MVEPMGDRLLPGQLVLPPRPRDTSKAPVAAASRAACLAFVLPTTGDISWGIWLLGGCLSAQGCALGGPESGESALGCISSRVGTSGSSGMCVAHPAVGECAVGQAACRGCILGCPGEPAVLVSVCHGPRLGVPLGLQAGLNWDS